MHEQRSLLYKEYNSTYLDQTIQPLCPFIHTAAQLLTELNYLPKALFT